MLNRLTHHTKTLIKSFLPEQIDVPLNFAAFERLMDRYVLSDFLTYSFADDENDCLWLDDNPDGPNSILLAYQISPLIIAGQKATYKLEKMLDRMPDGTIIGSFAYASNDLEGFLENWAMSRRNSRLPIFDLITKRRIKHILSWSKGLTKPMRLGNVYKPRLIQHYLFFRIPAPFKEYNHEDFQNYLNSINKIHNTINSQMTTANIPIKRLKGSEGALVIKSFINMHIPAKYNREIGINTNQSLPMQLIPSTTKHMLDKDGVLNIKDETLGFEKYIAVMNVNKYGADPHYLSETGSCIGSMIEADEFIPGDFYVYTIIEKQNAKKRIKDIGKKLAIVNWHTSIKSELMQNVFREHHKLKRIIYDYIENIKNNNGSTKVLCGIVIAENSKQELENACAYAETAWKGAGFELKRETTITFPAWLATLPGRFTSYMDGVDEGLQRGVTMNTLNAATLMHVQGDWMGSHPLTGGVLLLSRRGTPAILNFFETFKANFNALISASSGSGKSFLLNDLASDFLTRNGIIRIIDMGRSYYEVVERLSGQNVVCDNQSKLCFNIFSTLTTREILDESLATVSRLVAQMCFPNGYAVDDDPAGKKPWEESYIAYIVAEIWEVKRRNMSFEDLYEYCKEHQHEDARIKDLVMLLYKWAKGHYSRWMVGKWNINFDNPFIVFELDELKEDEDLQNVILNLLISRIANEMYYSWQYDIERNNGKVTPKLLGIDEAWYLLARPNGARFVEELARRVRKYNGSIVIITQSFMDMNANSAAQAYIENCNWILSLLQDIGTVKKAIKAGLIDLKEYALEILDSLHKTDDYSEIYVFNKSVKGEGVYRLVVDNASYWTYTTDPKDKNRIQELVSTGKTRSEAIDILSTQ